MNKIFITLVFSAYVLLASGKDIPLPQPLKSGGKPLMEVLCERKSTREYSSKNIDKQVLSNLLWAAYGFNREDKRVVPSSQNRQEIDLYVCLKEGIYLYDAKANKLLMHAKGDYRKDTGNQPFVGSAPLNLIYVANMDKASNRDAACTDCGFISQNVYLFCASEGLATVARGNINKQNLHHLLKLNDKQEVLLAQTIGYPL